MNTNGSEQNGVLRQVPVASIVPGMLVENDRKEFDPIALQELADSIGQHGLAQPPTLRPVPKLLDGVCRLCGAAGAKCKCPKVVHEIVAGERRFRAIKILGWKEVPAHVREMSDEQARDVMLLENIQRVDLSPIEEGNAYRGRMEADGLTVAQVAKKVAKTKRHVEMRLALVSLIPELQRMVIDGVVPIEHGWLMSSWPADDQRALMRLYAKRPLAKQELVQVLSSMEQARSQDSMFDLSDFTAKLAEKPQITTGPTAVIPVSAELLRYVVADCENRVEVEVGPRDTIGTVLHRHMLALEAAGLLGDAVVVYQVYRAVVNAGLCNVGLNAFGEVPPANW